MCFLLPRSVETVSLAPRFCSQCRGRRLNMTNWSQGYVKVADRPWATPICLWPPGCHGNRQPTHSIWIITAACSFHGLTHSIGPSLLHQTGYIPYLRYCLPLSFFFYFSVPLPPSLSYSLLTVSIHSFNFVYGKKKAPLPKKNFIYLWSCSECCPCNYSLQVINTSLAIVFHWTNQMLS